MTLTLRDATPADLPAIVALLADDAVAHEREDPSLPLDPAYRAAFDAIDADPNQRLIVAELDGAVMGTMQLSFLPGLSFRGAWRGQIEAVRVATALRGGGHGSAMIDWAVAECRARGCNMVQLTSHRTRTDAHRFYERLGWDRSHIGFKLHLTENH
ncbi:GNAT family N-acetyltransferase [Sphingomonas hengshuiensis]|uniref:GNAT family acetyltransferase n=1 Tax=Sphingomonas hengshuiensis TaxID=1609977 RepID=A0A7U4J737_9SPHN|nr:GNAT family N-acetyltransferase [Sphingomonas hengshuiensis]AJP71463.1 GNAT family acetyltransferase [Sphingomonas hengshuiensis]